MTLADYIARNAPVVVYLRLADGTTKSATIRSARELPFPADEIQGQPSLYLFNWDGIGSPLDNLGRRIVRIQAFPETERSGNDAEIFA